MTLKLEQVTIAHRHQSQSQSNLPMIGPLSLSIAPGEIYSLMGPSGCGKSTLLAYLAGALSDTFVGQGQILLNDSPVHDLPIEQRHIGILFQEAMLFPHFNVLENLMFASSVSGRKQKRADAMQALEEAGLHPLAQRRIDQLSGGQRARIGLLRTLQARPSALLLDEPFSKLDSETRGQFRNLVFNTIAERQIPALLVTHDEADIADSQRVLRLG